MKLPFSFAFISTKNLQRKLGCLSRLLPVLHFPESEEAMSKPHDPTNCPTILARKLLNLYVLLTKASAPTNQQSSAFITKLTGRCMRQGNQQTRSS
jgi:hypothetical protein